ncbi:MAG: CHAT domain-containing protein [Bacteroidales bacterium]
MLANRKIRFSGEEGDSLISREQESRLRIQQLYKQLQNIESSSVADLDVRQGGKTRISSELNAEQDNYDRILISLKLSNPDYSRIITPPEFRADDIRAAVPADCAVISYWISSENLFIWCITDKLVVQRTCPIRQETLTGLIENARTHIATSSPMQAGIELSSLYKYLIEPVEDVLRNKVRLVIIPNKGLHFLPFQALKGNDGKYLIERFALSYEPSLSVFSINKKRVANAGDNFFGAALSDVTVGLNSGLPGTKDELEKILPLFKDNLSSFGENSTETFVKENIGNFGFIHLATHGFFNFENPVYSFLLFPPGEKDDGRLTVHEVFGLRLNSRLVTLSACETGLGYLDRGDEMVSLSRSFIYSGSSAVIVSLWSVADYQTSLLMTKFYSYIASFPIDEALAMAQRDVIKIYPDPLYWAPFILIGE